MSTNFFLILWILIRSKIVDWLSRWLSDNYDLDYGLYIYVVICLWSLYVILYYRFEDECIDDVIKGTWNKTAEYLDLLYLYHFYYDIYSIIDNDLKFNAYKLNIKYKNNIECIICYDKFINSPQEQEQILLECGHRYCFECLYQHENVDDKLFMSIYNRCPFCNKYYSSFNKWKYDYNYNY